MSGYRKSLLEESRERVAKLRQIAAEEERRNAQWRIEAVLRYDADMIERLVATQEEGDVDADREREIRDDQTYVVLRALRAVLKHNTDPKLIEIIIEDTLEELRGGERYAAR